MLTAPAGRGQTDGGRYSSARGGHAHLAGDRPQRQAVDPLVAERRRYARHGIRESDGDPLPEREPALAGTR
jgi:hypothetical protein